jgi:putative ABC transport system ATP-binding protein
MMTIALETQAVSKVYPTSTGTFTAVAAVSLTIARGAFTALVGPSGSGKTTLLAMLAGLLAPTSGQVLINGQELGRMDEKQRTAFRRREIGFTFQANNLVPFLTVQENVELMLQINDALNQQQRQRVAERLERLGLYEHRRKLPAQLSGGQQQRVAIARALIHNPALVLADEPTASLDTERAYQVVETFADLIHEGERAGIMVTHDLRMCRHVDQVIHMTDGRIDRIITDQHEIAALAGDPIAAAPAV